jgi:ribose transport system ATP-binding protein
MSDADAVLQARGICKDFSGIVAVDQVNLTLRRGRLTAILGENGAGKSTLMNIIAGVLQPTAGQIFLDGQPIHFRNPNDARLSGIAMIHQELNLAPEMTVAENIFMGNEPANRFGWISTRAMHLQTARLMDRLKVRIDPAQTVGSLRVGQQQLVEIAKALAEDARVIIMDEPTSALSDHDTQVLFEIIADLKSKGVAIAYITHRLKELMTIGDDAIVMRDGKLMAACSLADLSHQQIVSLMVGRDQSEMYERSTAEIGEEALSVVNLSLRNSQRPLENIVEHISFSVHRGEVLGIFGLMGAGRTELLESIWGLHPQWVSREVRVDGELTEIKSPADAIAAGLAFVPEDRKRDGAVLGMSVKENMTLTVLRQLGRWGWINSTAEDALAADSIARLGVKTASSQQHMQHLSGGNQQKVILAKWLATQPTVLLLDEPTRGIDVNAKHEIYKLIDELKQDGLAVVMVSSELPEILAMSDRILVLCEGRLTAEFNHEGATEETLLHAALP